MADANTDSYFDLLVRKVAKDVGVTDVDDIWFHRKELLDLIRQKNDSIGALLRDFLDVYEGWLDVSNRAIEDKKYSEICASLAADRDALRKKLISELEALSLPF